MTCDILNLEELQSLGIKLYLINLAVFPYSAREVTIDFIQARLRLMKEYVTIAVCNSSVLASTMHTTGRRQN